MKRTVGVWTTAVLMAASIAVAGSAGQHASAAPEPVKQESLTSRDRRPPSGTPRDPLPVGATANRATVSDGAELIIATPKTPLMLPAVAGPADTPTPPDAGGAAAVPAATDGPAATDAAAVPDASVTTDAAVVPDATDGSAAAASGWKSPLRGVARAVVPLIGAVGSPVSYLGPNQRIRPLSSFPPARAFQGGVLDTVRNVDVDLDRDRDASVDAGTEAAGE